MILLFFDTETTDIKPERGSICQISYITVDTSFKPAKTEGKNFFFTVEDMSPGAEEVHGFSLEKLYELSEGLYFEDLCHQFINDFKNADIIIGHNVAFDIKFLTHELDSLGESFYPKKSFCTMNYYKPICRFLNSRRDIKNPKLQEVIAFLNIKEETIALKSNELFKGSGNYHDARFDTTATYLTVIEGIKKGFIPPHYFTQMMK